MEGYLLVDKPAGWTSFDVVKYVRSIVSKASGLPAKKVKVGHSGTLDPFATGLLIILVGKNYTKQAESLLKRNKSYQVVAELGNVSSTGDTEGTITKKSNHIPQKQEAEHVVNNFHGEIEQVPPAYSAIKVNGVRAYKLAREDKEVVIKSRTVMIYDIVTTQYDYPILEFRADVSSGTYIRSLVEDIGKALGTGAYTKALRRLSIGNCSIEQAMIIKDISEHNIKELLNTTPLVV